MKSSNSIFNNIQFCILLFISQFLNLLGNCQSPTLKFIHYTTKDGLPTSQIYQSFQDSRGYMWFTTDHGLIKYNGYEFKTYTTEEGLTDNTVFKIFEDHKNRLWLLTFAGGVCIYYNNKITPYKYNEEVKAAIRGNIPFGIYVDSTEKVFVSCHVWGEFSIDRSGKLYHEFEFQAKKGEHQVFFDEHRSDYLLTSIAAYGDTKQPLMIFYKSKTQLDSLIIEPIKQGKAHAIRLRDDRVLISISNRLIEMKNGRMEVKLNLPDEIYYLFEDSRNRLWIATTNGIYFYKSSNDFSSHVKYLNKNFISNIHEDNEGGFWITTLNNGLFYLANDKIRNIYFEDEFLHEPLVITSDNKSKIYVGFWSGAVATIENQRVIKVDTSFERTEINCLLFDSSTSKLLLGSRISGFLLHDVFHPFFKYQIPSIPLSFLKTTGGDIYASGDRVLYRIKSDSILRNTDFKIRINTLYEIKPGLLLLGSNNGAFLFNESNNKISLYCDQLKDVRIDDIDIFHGSLCFATRGKGLFFKKDDASTWIMQKDGLASNLIHKLVIDGNNIWCATNNGVSEIVFSDINNFNYSVKNITAKDGLPSNEVNDLLLFNDTIYASTSDGISFFNAKNNFISQLAPPVYFTSLRLNSTDTLPSGYYKLPYNMNNIRIGFEAPSFKSTSDISYRYILSNDEDSIINTTKIREANFLSLNPGNYVFKVTALYGDETQLTDPVVLKFTILKPFWLEWWFRILLFLITAIFVYLFVARHIKRIRSQEETKTAFNKQLVQFEIKALRAQMNPHFIFNVINSIQDYILKNDARSAQKYLTKFARLVRLILDNSVKAEVVLGEELKVAQLYVELEQQRFENKFEFILHVDDEVDVDQIILPAMIIQPYLENAIKHGIRHLPLQGKLMLEVLKQENYIIIMIEDNGVGRAASAESNKTNVRDHVSYGTIITAKRIDAYNNAYKSDISAKIYDLKNNDDSPAGTRIVMRVPVKYMQIADD